MADTDSKPRTVHIEDKRPKAREHSNFTGDYDENLIRSIIEWSQYYGINPYHALGIALQENNFNRVGIQGLGANFTDPETAGSGAPQRYEDGFVRSVMDKMAYARDTFGKNAPEDLQLQAYNNANRTHWTNPGEYDSSGRLNMVTDRPYGRRVQDHITYSLKPNADIQRIIQEAQSD